MNIKVLFEDKDIIVCEKPPGVPSQSDKTGDYDMVNHLKNYIYEKDSLNSPPYIGVVHRLDRPVGGIMVFAKTPFAAKNLSAQVTNRSIKKSYLAVVCTDLTSKMNDEKKLLTDFIVKDGRTNLSSITTERNKNGKKAELFYKVQNVRGGLSLVEIELLTGRHHQIRVQMKEHVAGLWGDSKYNAEFQNQGEWKNIGLYANRIEFYHPKTGKRMKFEEMPKGEAFLPFINYGINGRWL